VDDVIILKKIKTTVCEYLGRLRMFQPNARLYLMTVLVTGIAMGVYRLIFNFYVLSLGYDEALLGKLITTNQFTALLLALPMGFLVDRFGRKNGLMVRSLLLAASVAGTALWPEIWVLYLMNIFFGVVQSLSSVVMSPFLMENSGEEERTYLFSFSSGLMMVSASIGNWLGGYLPTWMGAYQDVDPESSIAYAWALASIALVAFLGMLPVTLLKPGQGEKIARSFDPVRVLREKPALLSKLLLPSLIISIGAGLFMPFMNVFFREVHAQSDQVIGTLFAWGSLAMGAGLLLAPVIAERIGKIQLVVLSQGLSIPFMILLGFAPFTVSALAYYVRMALMNMSSPIYQTFVMEKVDASERTTVASLASMVWNSGRAFSPSISGWLQVNYGFIPVFVLAILLYACAVPLYWQFFLRKQEGVAGVLVNAD
jgi:MFS family permease